MRKDSFNKNVRFGGSGHGSKTTIKSPSPRTLANQLPASNPFKDIQSSFPTQFSYFSHDVLLLWIIVLGVVHLFGQLYLIYGDKFYSWDWNILIVSLCCIVDKMYSVNHKVSVFDFPFVLKFNFILLGSILYSYY
jgi:hypothetical protein